MSGFPVGPSSSAAAPRQHFPPRLSPSATAWA
jgi:hypothetical protein